MEEGAAPSLRRGGRWEEPEYRERERAGSRLERGSVVSRQIQVLLLAIFSISFLCRFDLEVSRELQGRQVWVQELGTPFQECPIQRQLAGLTFRGMKPTKTSNLWLVMGAVVIRP